ncbi:MAG: dihydropteroate synthase [Gemmatimonadetes bacterium]|nr:dihydropteroate synthase [Gemmatimonadota bacterium]
MAELLPRRDPGRATRLLGVLNLTPDSFHDGGLDPTALASIERARLLVEEGADALDLGGESTRPDAKPVPAAEELARVLPVLHGVLPLGVPISVDTMKAPVAAAALEAGATWINDVTGLQHDPEIADVCAAAGAGLVLMHMRGTPRTMKNLTDYDDVVEETIRFLDHAVDRAVRAGVRDDRIVVDPGLGFAKSADHNLEILRRLPEYLRLGRPILVGASRKSFLARYDGQDSEDRLEGTLATTVLAVIGGASILRVHDVAANRKSVEVTEAVLRARLTPRVSTEATC